MSAGDFTVLGHDAMHAFVRRQRIAALRDALAMVDGAASPQQIHGRIDGLLQAEIEGLADLCMELPTAARAQASDAAGVPA